MQLVGLCQVLVFLRILAQPARRWRVAFVVLSTALFYLHYTAALLVAGECVAYVALSLRAAWRPAYRPLEFLADVAIWLVTCLPAAPHLTAIAARRHNWTMFIQRQPFGHIWTIFPLTWYLLLPVAVALVGWAVCTVVRLVTARRESLPPGSAASGSAGGPSSGDLESGGPWWDSRLVVVLVCWLFVPLVLAWCSTAADWLRLFFSRT